MEKLGCPGCLKYCNCTACCRKRGVEYVSTKVAAAAAGNNSLSLSHRPAVVRQGSSPPKSDFSSATPSPPLPPAKTGVYWSTIYRLDGTKIGPTYQISQPKGMEEPDVVLMKPISAPRKKESRVFVGKIQPSWRLGKNVKTREIDPVPKRRKEVPMSRKPRMYVGKRALLFYKSEQEARELADLSPLSSLEEDWAEEETMEPRLLKPTEENSLGQFLFFDLICHSHELR